MNEAFDDEEFEPVEQRHDTELTLGSTTLLTLFFGLVVVCGLCFGLGYAVGHHGTPEPSAASLPPAGNQQSGGGDALRGKPSAAPQPKAPQPARAVINLPTPTAAGTSPALSGAAGHSAGASAVKPALPQQGNGLRVQPATVPTLALMVQIAAVANAEDAQVLVNALRKRSYAVTVRREASDSMIHVQIGPFANRAEADAMRQKLLNDGYNAIVQP